MLRAERDAGGGEGGNAGRLTLPLGTGGDPVIMDGGSSTGGTDETVDPDAACASTEVSSTLKSANLLFVVDQSGSMNCNLPEDGYDSEQCAKEPIHDSELGPSKWELTREALVGAIDALAESGVAVSVGLTMFPVADTRCDVAREPDVPLAKLTPEQQTRIESFLSTVSPGGETPLAGATILGYDYLYQQLRAGALPGNTYLVLLTDGYETCALEPTDYTEVLLEDDAPEAWAALGIRTFVIGAPGSEDAHGFLSRLAQVGTTRRSADCTRDGTAHYCHFDMTQSTDFAGDLAATLDLISGTVLTCELEVPINPTGEGVNYEEVNVRVNDVEYRRADGCVESRTTGWQYNRNRTLIQLCGDACAEAQSANAVVEILLGCPTKII